VDDDSDTVKDDGCPSIIYDYDDADRLVEVIDALGQSTTYGYDDNGNRTSVTNAREKTTTYDYDELNRLESVTDPLSRVTSYEYDAAGNLSQRTDGNEQTTTYTYDDANRLTNIDYPVGTADVSFTYDAVGNRETMEDGTGTTTYDYDDLNRLTPVTFPGSRTVGYDYDNVGDRTSITYPRGSNDVTYAYDEAHNLETVADWNEAVTTYTYDDAGQLAESALPNDVVSTYTYDGADRLTGITHVKGEDTLAFVEYTLDAVGNRTERVDGLGTHSYTYDELYRLTEVTYPGPSTTSYTYDPVGNRETMEDNSGTTTYDYDDADQLTSVTPPGQQAIEYSWDDNGNLLERGADSYDWDAANRMTSATVASVTTTMAYNGDGLRDSRTVGEDTVTFTWDLAQSVSQIIDDGSLAYVHGLGRISQVAADDTTYYYLGDGLGSTMALTDADGDVVNTYDYDVLGAVSSQTGSQPNEILFTGEQNDPTGLEYLRARYYDPAIGRFVSRDPLGSLNRYAYVLNNPCNLIDPWGLQPDGRCGPPTPGMSLAAPVLIGEKPGVTPTPTSIPRSTPTPTPTPTRRPVHVAPTPFMISPCGEVVPDTGQGSGGLLSMVRSMWDVLTNRCPACYTTGSVAAGTGALSILQPETAPWAFPAFLMLLEPAVTSCVVDQDQ
jgi:RHS repeat-associated protein